MRGIILFFLLAFMTCNLQAQNALRDEIDRQMETAKSQMAAGDYEEANRTFRKILSLNTVLPNDLSYLFAETLYMIGQYHNSHNFLQKYIKLTGKAGNYTQQAEELDALLDKELARIRSCNLCDFRGYLLHTCTRCEGEGIITDVCTFCHAKGSLTCHTCLGEGVLIVRNEFGQPQYKTCPTCMGTGTEDCPICKGEKITSQQCPVCLGSGKESSKEICQHPELEQN